MKNIIFIDSEISKDKKTLMDFGMITNNNDIYHGLNTNLICDVLKKYYFICGHNIVEHDYKYLSSFFSKLSKFTLVDTLSISPLLYPKKIYHSLLKNDKIFSEELNNPLNDAKKCKDLFFCEIELFNNLPGQLQNIYGTLLYNQELFKGFFEYVNWKKIWDLKKQIISFFDGKICVNSPLSFLISEHPIELAYALALIYSSEKNEVFSPWIHKKFPFIEKTLKLLRSTPCDKYCSYCNNAFSAETKLYQFFNYKEFREYAGEKLQEKAVKLALAGKSLLAVFPTGGGKSLTFQLPALMEGENSKALTVVISPLQSLMKDQVDGLEKKGIVDAVTINGLLDPNERKNVIERVQSGSANILYISPELLRSKTIEQLLLHRTISRFVIDEAHCFSSWGHDFRVDYLYIGDFIKYIQEKKKLDYNIPVSCFTATAKQKVISDIKDYFKEKLGLELELCATTATRTNLHYKVEIKNTDEEKYYSLRELISSKNCPTIVYVSRTNTTLLLAQKLCDDGFTALPFNGKMDSQDKIINQDKFMHGDVQIIVATSAFGMGVDKSDVKLVVHYEISDSLENYVQEAGRAGRDQNLDADCVVYFNENDLNKHFTLLNNSKLTMQEIRQIWNAIKKMTNKRKTISCSALEIARQAGWSENKNDVETRVRTAISALEASGYVERGFNSPRIFATSIKVKSVIEAREKITKSNIFDSKEIEDAVLVMQKLISSKCTKVDDAEARVDYLADLLGLDKSYVITLIDKLKSINILANSNDMHGHFKYGDINRTNNELDRLISLENYFIDYIENFYNKDKKILNLKEFNDTALKDGIKRATIDKIKKIIVFWKIKNYWSKDAKLIGDRIEIDLELDIKNIREIFEKRIEIAKFVVNHLAQINSTDEDDYLKFSLIDVMNEFNNRQSLFTQDVQCNVQELQNALLYLTKTGILSIDGGFLVLYNAMQITRLIKDNKIQYKTEDYKALKEHYNLKIQQIHIVGEYANMMVSSYNEALTFVHDYFNLQYDGFIKKYFKGNRLGEIKRNITPNRYNMLFGDLSNVQREIIDDDSSQFITVLAGPGSGKTKVLVHKMAALILLEDVKADQLLMLTFSRSAATEFKSRLIDLIGEYAHFVEIKTFHSYCFDLIGKLGKKTNENELHNIINEAVEIIENNEVEQEKITKAVIVIDEAQDMNYDEYKLVKALIERNPDVKIIAVGDDDQNIYEFRNSDSKYMQELGINSTNSKIYELLENYRSVHNIVSFANSFLKTFANRMKHNNIRSVKSGNGNIGLAKYTAKSIEKMVVDSVLKRKDINEKLAILTSTNEESLRVLSLLSKKGIKAKLIQSHDGLNLFNFIEFRFFYNIISQNDTPIVLDEVWDNAKKELQRKYASSTSLEIILSLIDKFEKTTKCKYKSDLLDFVHESEVEDFIDINNCNYIVSTLHKSKGREFDTVHILLNNKSLKTDTERRVVYVGMTRAKNNLFIHYNNNLFDHYSKKVLYKENTQQCDEAEEIIIPLSHRDVNLGYFKLESIQYLISRRYCGDELSLENDYLCFENKKLIKFSSKFNKYFNEQVEKGYQFYGADIKYIIYWKDPDEVENKEYLIILPTIYMRKELKNIDILFDENLTNKLENIDLTNAANDIEIETLDENTDLLLLLKKERKLLAIENGIPAYIVASNQTLLELATFMPINEKEFIKIKGMGPAKFQMYGERFINVIKNYKKN